jgi:hypothetical protein
MTQATDLATHIQNLIAANPAITKDLPREWFYPHIPPKLPAIYLDGIVLTDDKQDRWTFNICFVTTDMSLAAIERGKMILRALQVSHCIQAQGLLPRPEVDLKRNRFIIPCVAYMTAL